MNEEIYRLKPERLWYYFGEILKIPRPSKKEEKIADFLLEFGRDHQLETIRDSVGNILIRKGASPGSEKAPSIALQGHIDMVCEKNADHQHDFDNDPIRAYIEGNWVKAVGTTLGADDGIGIAAMLAILESGEIQHGPLECLFTVDEESGLTGAFGLDPTLLKSRILLNLDSEDDGEFFIGCAGGRDTVIRLPFKKETPKADHESFIINVKGLTGGHSGDDIHKGRGNANKILNRFLLKASRKHGIKVASFSGGNLRNAIAREASAGITVPKAHAGDIKEDMKKFLEQLKAEYRVTEPKLDITLNPSAAPAFIIDEVCQNGLLNALYGCPHGVMAWSQTIPGFVETSTNLASVKMMEDHFLIATSQRSSVESAKEDICEMVASVFRLAGAEVEHSNGYPGWTPNPHSRIVELAVDSYRSLFGEKPVVRAIHAGLECGLIGDKYPGMDMISYGPTIRGAHSPDEKLEISAVNKFWDLTLDLLKRSAAY